MAAKPCGDFRINFRGKSKALILRVFRFSNSAQDSLRINPGISRYASGKIAAKLYRHFPSAGQKLIFGIFPVDAASRELASAGTPRECVGAAKASDQARVQPGAARAFALQRLPDNVRRRAMFGDWTPSAYRKGGESRMLSI